MPRFHPSNVDRHLVVLREIGPCTRREMAREMMNRASKAHAGLDYRVIRDAIRKARRDANNAFDDFKHRPEVARERMVPHGRYRCRLRLPL